MTSAWAKSRFAAVKSVKGRVARLGEFHESALAFGAHNEYGLYPVRKDSRVNKNPSLKMG